ncbi:MAG: hypothetical protein KDN22_28095 [Verrucomicrobiae bacterium]|nr:hypothetical protein [Verrucomicrobiae bacterium]
MKRTVFSVFTSLAAIVFLGACEQHSWEETKHLTQPHGDHAVHASGGEHESHAKDGHGAEAAVEHAAEKKEH